jgi:hypothetical protein
MHGEEHGVELGGHLPALHGELGNQPPQNRHMLPGKRQLPPHGERQRPTKEQHEQRGNQELNPDDLVIG